MLIAFGPKQLFRWLLACIGALVCLHLLTLAAVLAFPVHGYEKLHHLFDLGGEGNVPATYSTVQLVFAAMLILVLHDDARRSQSQDRVSWLLLAAVFVFLAVDEYESIHERLMDPVRELLGAGNVPLFAWVVPYAVFVAAFAAYYFRFWWRLPRDIRWQVALSAAIFVGGAMGMEMVGSRIYETLGPQSPWYLLEVIVEETMEMIGIALFIRTLAKLIQARVGSLTFQFDTRAIENHRELMQDLQVSERRRGERRLG
jgi:hypothetical protein